MGYLQIGESKTQKQHNLFKPLLSDFIDMRHELIRLSEGIDWKYFEDGFSGFYSHIGKPAQERMTLSDTTVQQNNTTFWTDSKLAKKIIDKSNAIAKREGINQSTSNLCANIRTINQRTPINPNHPKRKKKAKKAAKS